MEYTVIITESAEVDIQDAVVWYEEQLTGLGTLFIEFLNEVVELIRLNPLQFQIRYRTTRIAFLQKFPYGIHYVLDETEVLIVAVFHTSRDSGE